MKWISFLAVLSIVSGECPEGWTRFQQTCLAFFLKPVTWSNAQTECRSYNARLATLETRTKDLNMQMFLQTLDHRHGHRAWVGGNDIVRESHWVWNDDHLSNFTYTNWNDGEPNNLHTAQYHGEDCLAVRALSQTYGWMDSSCEERPLPFVCEKDVGPPLLLG